MNTTAPAAPASTRPRVRFVKTCPTGWNGNGFGTSKADWIALVGDVEVGRFENDGRVAIAFGEHALTRRTTGWRQAVLRAAARIEL